MFSRLGMLFVNWFFDYYFPKERFDLEYEKKINLLKKSLNERL